MVPSLRTARLRLTPCSLEAARASLDGPSHVERVLGVEVPETWPPEDLVDALRAYAGELSRDPSLLGWGIWLAVVGSGGALVGSAGFKGRPDRDGCVEIGYGIEPGFRRRGYASEAVGALTRWAWRQGARRIVAECRPNNQASIRVLERNGMRRTRSHNGMLWWEICGPT